MSAELYDELGRLMARPDAFDRGSETARAIAELDAELTEHERAEAEVLAREFEERLLMPIDAGARAAYRFDELVARFSSDDYRQLVKAAEHSDILAIMATARECDLGTTIVVPTSATATAANCEASKKRFNVFGITFVDEAAYVDAKTMEHIADANPGRGLLLVPPLDD